MGRASKPVVLITGVSSGIGLATAKLFAANGWIVVGTVRGRSRSADLRVLQLDLQVADMVKPRELERVVTTAWRTYGRLDALVCNAGYGLIGPIDTVNYMQMSEQLAVNTLAPAELARLVVPLMRRQGYGVIVGVSSVIGRTGVPGYSLYAASKFGLEGLFESLAMELAPSGIRVKLVEPSGVNTPFWDGLRRGAGRKWRSAELGGGFGESGGQSTRGLSAETVGLAILRAVGDRSAQLRYPLGRTRWMGYARRFLPDRWVLRALRRVVSGN